MTKNLPSVEWAIRPVSGGVGIGPDILIHAEEIFGSYFAFNSGQPLVIAPVGRADAVFAFPSIMKLT